MNKNIIPTVNILSNADVFTGTCNSETTLTLSNQLSGVSNTKNAPSTGKTYVYLPVPTTEFLEEAAHDNGRRIKNGKEPLVVLVKDNKQKEAMELRLKDMTQGNDWGGHLGKSQQLLSKNNAMREILKSEVSKLQNIGASYNEQEVADNFKLIDRN